MIGAGTVEAVTAREKRVADIIITNIEQVPGMTITRHLGMVQGNTVRSKHAGRDIMAGFKNLVGGELKGYTELLTESREEATERMIEQARSIGANAVVNVRFSTSSVTAGASELFVYGTAVVVKPGSTNG
jgi:uncharacterized protein YbjQ (UPF0145 family)